MSPPGLSPSVVGGDPQEAVGLEDVGRGRDDRLSWLHDLLMAIQISSSFGPPRLAPLRWWWVVLAGLVVAAAGIGIGWWAWRGTRNLVDPELAKAQMDAIRTGLTAAGGAGAVFALLLAVRRQRSTEIALQVQEEAAADVRHDSKEKRITELYTKSVEQLGSEQAAVRLGGFYSLERLAQDNIDHRQTIVDVICAYLRLRPEGQELDDREREVRFTAGRILSTHLKQARDRNGEITGERFWPDIDIDLTGAVLVELDLGGAVLRTARFNNATFDDIAWFTGSTFTNHAWFDGVVFTDMANFVGATFQSGVRFDGARFTGLAQFDQATFGNRWDQDGVPINVAARFDSVEFEGPVRFDETRFSDDAVFARVTFRDEASFDSARFARVVSFDQATFGAAVTFDEALARQHDRHA